MVLEQVPDHQHPSAVTRRRDHPLRLLDRLRERLLDKAVLARAQHPLGELPVAGDGGGQGDRVELIVLEQIVDEEVARVPGYPATARSSRSGEESQSQVSRPSG